MLSLGFPFAIVLLPLPLLIWKYLPAYRQTVQALRVPFFRQLTEAADLEVGAGSAVLRRNVVQIVVACVVWICLIAALARPERLGEPVVIETSARDMVIALDISGSMDERDFIAENGSRQQRLSAVKEVLTEFIAARDGDRIALIIFGTRAFVQAPFSEDLQSLSGFLDQTVVGMAGPNTAIGDAIGLAVRTFDASEVDQRLLILLSDGADTSSRMTPINAADIAAQRGVTIQTIGVGDPEGAGEGRVDLAALEQIAGQTGGAFYFAGDKAALEQIYDQIDQQNPRAVETSSFRPTESLAHVPIGIALGALLIGLIALQGLKLRREGLR